MILVESGGVADAHNKPEDARGILQIRAICVEDVNRIYGTDFDHDDAWDPTKSKAIYSMYLSYYGSEERLGRKPTAEDLARIWNGGPLGYRKTTTRAYWARVKLQMNQLKDSQMALAGSN